MITLALADAETRFDHVRKADGELVGYIAMTDDGFVAYDLLHRQQSQPTELDACEALLDETGLRAMAGTFVVPMAGVPQRVRIVELTREAVTVCPVLGADLSPAEARGDSDADAPAVATGIDLTRRLTLPLPAPELRPAD